MPRWLKFPFTLTADQFARAKAAESKYGARAFLGLEKELEEAEAEGRVKLADTESKLRFVIGMARYRKEQAAKVLGLAIPIEPGKPYKSAELPVMRFKLDEARKILEEARAGS